MINQPFNEPDALLRMSICSGEARVMLMSAQRLREVAVFDEV